MYLPNLAVTMSRAAARRRAPGCVQVAETHSVWFEMKVTFITHYRIAHRVGDVTHHVTTQSAGHSKNEFPHPPFAWCLNDASNCHCFQLALLLAFPFICPLTDDKDNSWSDWQQRVVAPCVYLESFALPFTQSAAKYQRQPAPTCTDRLRKEC